ncbi:MAG: hypothetical protein LBK57_01410 [Clostridiales Family XIII bacterium]|jgi:hypothetical protein|nr:hypothetical protein [Clostridiales Family XIII bacterium]
MEHREFFSPGQYQYLYCFHRLFDGKRTMRNLVGAMGVPRSTAYYNINLLTEKGFLVRQGGGYVLSEKGLETVGMDRDTLDNLVFWILYDLDCAEDEAHRIATGFICRQPITTLRRLASAATSRAALSRAGVRVGGSLAALPRGRHGAMFSVRRRRGETDEKTADGKPEPGRATRKPAVFIVGKDRKCALELYAAHIRRIAASAMPRGHRMIPRRLLYGLGGNMIECREFAGRWHIRGDAVTEQVSADGELTGSVRVFAENTRGERYEAEILLRFGRILSPDR